MAASSRRKGIDAEREVARIWQAAGFAVRGLEAEGDHLVVCGNGLIFHSEVKRQERVRMPEWVRQADAEAAPDTTPVVTWRQNRGVWRADLALDDLALLAAAHRG